MKDEIKKGQSKLIAIVGPTATGKTAVGIELAKRVAGEIISVDSMAVYKYMDLGTAKPTPQERASVPFYLIDIVCPDQEFSVVEFKSQAEQAIADILDRGKVPILVGGTGLYIQALMGDYNVPQAEPNFELRQRLVLEAQECGNNCVMERLRAVDPVTAARLHANDLKRIIRAIEVFEATGIPISRFHQYSGRAEPLHSITVVGLTVDRSILYERIERRIDQWIEEGLVEEVEGLLKRGYSPSLPAMKGLGYRQIAGYLLGEYDLAAAVDLLKRDTRRFAKRQFTWFKRMSIVRWIDVDGRTAPDIAEEIEHLMRATA